MLSLTGKFGTWIDLTFGCIRVLMPLYFLQRVFLRFTAHVVTATIKHMAIVTTHREMTRTVKIIPGFDIPGGFGPGRIFEA